MKTKLFPCAVTIAGTDPSGGAGIQADIKAISATGAYAASIITALVAQNTQGVQAIHDLPPEFIHQQIQSVFSDLTVSAIKIGMLSQKTIIQIVSETLQQYNTIPVVLDPVVVAKSGHALLPSELVETLKQELFPHVTLITPNIPEAEILLSNKIQTETDMANAAETLGKQFNINVLLKGGHLNSAKSSDVLYLKDKSDLAWLHTARIDTKNTHGTGCTLSSAIASYLAQGYTLYDAILHAKKYLTQAIIAGADLSIGHGAGPVNHFYYLADQKNHERII